MKRPSKLTSYYRSLILSLITAMSLALSIPATQAANDNVEFSQAELDQMLAPIALYPDTLLSQVLIAATYPIEVVQADRWARSNSDLKGEDAVKFVEKKDWDPSVKTLVAFPDILKKMSEDIDWTQRLGDAFLSDENRVMDTVQRLRKRAYAAGSLDKAQHIRAERDDNIIVIEPAEERVVYVPVYDTRVVYGNWWWPDYPPVYWSYPGSYVYTSGFYWGTSIYIGPSYYYSSCRWRDRRVVVIDRDDRYYRAPHFYTSRSVISFEGSREWRHDPIHRRGVAYYNDNLRDNYGSRHDSYQRDRDYRDQYRERREERHEREPIRPNHLDDNRLPGIPRSENPSNRTEPIDRSEQLRARMIQAGASRTNNNAADNNTQPQQSNDNNERQQIDRHFFRQTPESRETLGNSNNQPAPTPSANEPAVSRGFEDQNAARISRDRLRVENRQPEIQPSVSRPVESERPVDNNPQRAAFERLQREDNRPNFERGVPRAEPAPPAPVSNEPMNRNMREGIERSVEKRAEHFRQGRGDDDDKK